jgi:hypothetical protein
MRILPDIEQSIRRVIRDERAKDPIISVVELQEKLERQFNRTFKHYYIKRLADKVSRQTLLELDRTQIEQRMAFTRAAKPASESQKKLSAWRTLGQAMA